MHSNFRDSQHTINLWLFVTLKSKKIFVFSSMQMSQLWMISIVTFSSDLRFFFSFNIKWTHFLKIWSVFSCNATLFIEFNGKHSFEKEKRKIQNFFSSLNQFAIDDWCQNMRVKLVFDIIFSIKLIFPTKVKRLTFFYSIMSMRRIIAADL